MSRKLIASCLAVTLVVIAGVVCNDTFGTPKSLVPLNTSIAGMPPAPEGKVTQYVVNCGDLPGKCPAILSMTPIYTDMSELGFELTDPESLRQFNAAVQVQTKVLSDMRNSGLLPEIERAALSAYVDAVLSGGLARGEAESQELIASYLDARSALPGDRYTTDAKRRKPPGSGCTFGSPCPGGKCGTILDSGTKFASCVAACIDCYRI